MKMTPYLVSEFQKSTLSALIRECFGYDFADIFSKPQVTYLFNYLSSFDPKCVSVLLEPEYIDREFLEDYSRYYVKRFDNDGYVCGRLHFFSCAIDHRSLDKLFLGEEPEGLTAKHLQEHYLGFVIIKPLSRTFVGKTCLRVIGDVADGDGTKKKIARQYDVNLFGIKLHVCSIAFQEQDKVVAACATTSIWTALHGLPWRDVRHVPSCSEITIAALNFVDGSNNGFPNKELTNKQIQRSLDVQGLRYHSTGLLDQTQEWFRACVTAYTDSELPLILMGDVYGLSYLDVSEGASGPGRSAPAPARKGVHAVTVLGYDFREGAKWLYIHDDRLGPYARAQLMKAEDLLPGCTDKALVDKWILAFSQRDANGNWERPHEILLPDACIVPADKKARLPFQYAYGTATTIATQLEDWLDQACVPGGIQRAPLTFNIKLSSIAKVRDSVIEEPVGYDVGALLVVDPEDAEDGALIATPLKLERWRQDKIKFLTSPMARLHWEIDFSWGQRKVFKVLLDATDIPLGDAVSAIYVYDLLYAELFLEAFDELQTNPHEADRAHFYGSFVKALKRRDDDYESHLNKTYGALRAPRKLEESEVGADGKGSNPTLKHLYDPEGTCLAEVFQDVVDDPIHRNLIWAIGRDGSLFVAEDMKAPHAKLGHPSMTGLQAARIAGEMWWVEEDGGSFWYVNCLSGRYSKDYATAEAYLTNAVRKIASFFLDGDFQDKGKTRPERVEEQLRMALAEADTQ